MERSKERENDMKTCRECLIQTLSHEDLDVKTWCACNLRYVRDDVIASLRAQKIVKVCWDLDRAHCLVGLYYLNKKDEKVRRMLNLPPDKGT